MSADKKTDEKIRAGEIVPFSVIAYKPFLKEKLNYEIQGYIKKLKGEIYYVRYPKQLDRTIKMMLKSKKT
ncbi:MAG: hypothetical protein NZ893_01420 [Candidatus Aenigmarchaeota archaeon]|nr:hypothetical protein [Candidatus Aenigmarchaeota archaeon]